MELRRDPDAGSSRPALFLDRDGVIVVERHYLHRPDEVEVIPGCAETIRAAHAAGWFVVMVTNQAGIGRGLFDWPDFAAVNARIHEDLAASDAQIDMVLACPFHPDARRSYRSAAHPWRKPAPGMLLAAAQVLPIRLNESVIVGDRGGDLGAGRAAGCRLGILVSTGYGARERSAAAAMQTDRFAVGYADSVGDVAALMGWSAPDPDCGIE